MHVHYLFFMDFGVFGRIGAYSVRFCKNGNHRMKIADLAPPPHGHHIESTGARHVRATAQSPCSVAKTAQPPCGAPLPHTPPSLPHDHCAVASPLAHPPCGGHCSPQLIVLIYIN